MLCALHHSVLDVRISLVHHCSTHRQAVLSLYRQLKVAKNIEYQSELNKYWLDLEFTDIIKGDIAKNIQLGINNINDLKYLSILLLSFNHSDKENTFESFLCAARGAEAVTPLQVPPLFTAVKSRVCVTVCTLFVQPIPLSPRPDA